MITAVDKFAAVCVMATAVSHVTHPNGWAAFFRTLVQRDIAEIVIPMYTLPLGVAMLVARSSWDWGWPAVFVALAGAFVLKSAIYISFPGIAERTIVRHGLSAPIYRKGGLALMPLALLLLYGAFWSG
jgi:hypothetical protein